MPIKKRQARKLWGSEKENYREVFEET